MEVIYNAIDEVIDSLLPQDRIDIVYSDMPDMTNMLLIEETRAEGQLEILEGYEGVIESNIQFYVKKEAVQGATVGIRQMLEEFYGLVYEQIGKTVGNYSIENVSMFEISPTMRDKDNNVIQSLDFRIRYRRI